MKITEITKQKSNIERYNIYIDNNYNFSASAEDIIKYNIAEDREFEADELDAVIKLCEYTKAYDYGLKLLSIKDYSEKQMEIKIKSKGFSDVTISMVIEKLKSYNFINDERYAKKYIKDCIRIKGYGTNKILFNLQNQGIPRNIIENLDIDESIEYENAVKLGEKKLNTLNGKEKKYEKIYRYLISRGYRYEVVKKVLDYLNENESSIE